VLLQLFRGYDVLNWDWVKELNNLNEQSVVFVISFNEKKKGESSDIDRFFKSGFYSTYKSFSSNGHVKYLYTLTFSSLFQKLKLIKEIKKVIETVYLFEPGEKVTLSLDIY